MTESHEPGTPSRAATIRRIGPEEYDELCHRVGEVVGDATPPDAIVAVVSKGDPRLVELEARTGLHFPGDEDGRYAGYHPRTSDEAVAQVESLRRAGTQFFCLPATAFWWLDHYQGFAAWLQAHCDVAVHDPETCIVYDLQRPPGDPDPARRPAAEVSGAATAQVRSLLDALLPEDALLLVFGHPPEGLAAAGRKVAPLGDDAAVAAHRLAAFEGERPTFVLVGRDSSSPPLDAALEELLASHAEPVAHREHLCDVMRVIPDPGNRSVIMRNDRPGFGSQDSSSAPAAPISERQT